MSEYIKVKDILESIDFILKNNCSVARFGDGEIDIISGSSIPYQEYDKNLANDLKHILSLQSTENFLVCVSDIFERRERYNDNFKFFWEKHLEKFEGLYKEICKASWYGSTFISRPYIDLVDKTHSIKYFEKIKLLWDSKDILIVEGETSRSGIGNDLFANSNSIKRIIAPSKNAYSKKEWIKSKIRKYGKDKLVLLMLGPTAKVVSYELSKENYHLIDLGHIDSEYEWFKMGATYKVKLSNKHTAEYNYDENIIFDNSGDYNNQIICKYSDYINIAFCVDNNYAKHLEILLYSIAKNNLDNNLMCYVIYKQTIDESIKTRLKYIENYNKNIKLHYLKVFESDIENIDVNNYYLPIESYYRILLPKLLQNEDKVIYLDVDTLVLEDIEEFWNIKLGEYYLAGVAETFNKYREDLLSPIGFTSCDNYLNAGVLLMNLRKMRENNTTEELIKLAKKRHKDFKFADQDLINLYFKNQILFVDKKFNYINDFLLTEDYMNEDIVILHYNGSHITKPWNNIVKIPNYLHNAVKIYKDYQKECYTNLLNYYKLVSVVLPFYNASKHLVECIDSVLNQTYPNIELIIVDANSTDDSYNITKKYLEDKRVRLFKEKYDTLAFALKKGITEASGEYITVLEQDDFLESNFVDVLMANHSEDIDVLISNYYTYSERDKVFYYHNFDDNYCLENISKQDLLDRLSTNNKIYNKLFGKIFKKEILKEMGHFTLSEKEVMKWLYHKVNNARLVNGNYYVYRDTISKKVSLTYDKKFNEKDLISVVVPVYNASSYLDSCILSIINQSYKNLEIILIDDASYDNSLEICNNYEKKDNRIKVYTKENGGAGDSRNYGVERSNGEFIYFVDSDDILNGNAILDLYRQQQIHNADIVCGNYYNYYEVDKSYGFYVLDEWFCTEEVSKEEAIIRQSAWKYNTSNFILPINKLYRKNLFKNVSYPKGYIFEDDITTHKLFLNSKKIILVNNNSYVYRIRENSVMTSPFTLKKVDDLLYMIKEKLSDIVFYANVECLSDARNRCYKLLKDYKKLMEENNYVDTEQYKEILQKIKLYELGENTRESV